MSIENNQAGIVVGAGAGAYKGITIIFAQIAAMNTVPWELLIQTALFALVGGAFGWLGSAIMNGLKSLYIKWRAKHDKDG